MDPQTRALWIVNGVMLMTILFELATSLRLDFKLRAKARELEKTQELARGLRSTVRSLEARVTELERQVTQTNLPGWARGTVEAVIDEVLAPQAPTAKPKRKRKKKQPPRTALERILEDPLDSDET